MLITLALVASIAGLGYATRNLFGHSSEFLPRYRVPWYGDSVIYYHMDYVLNSDEYNDVIFLGSSATMAGLHTLAFEQQTGLRTYNLGTVIDLGPDGQLEMAKAYVANHPKPRMLVYLAFPRDVGDKFTSDPSIRIRFARAYNAPLDESSVNTSARLKDYFSEGYWSIYGMLKTEGLHPYDVDRGGRLSHRELGPALSAERGWQPYPQAGNLNLGYLSGLNAFTVSDWYEENLAAMANYAQDQDIAFVVCFMPVPRFIREIDDGPVLAWASRFRSRFPQAGVMGLPIEVYEHPLWGNGFHLNHSGADVFTEHVGRTLQELVP